MKGKNIAVATTPIVLPNSASCDGQTTSSKTQPQMPIAAQASTNIPEAKYQRRVLVRYSCLSGNTNKSALLLKLSFESALPSAFAIARSSMKGPVTASPHERIAISFMDPSRTQKI